MNQNLEQLRATIGRVANVHELLSLGNFQIQGGAARKVVDAIAFIEGLHSGMVADLQKLEGEAAKVPTAPKLAEVKTGNFKGKHKGKKPGPVPVKEEAAK